MTQAQKYIWLIETLLGAGQLTLEEINQRWKRNSSLSSCEGIHRSTFVRWRDEIRDMFGVVIDCKRIGGYHYFIANPEAIREDQLRGWMFDSLSVGNLISENLALNNRILVDRIPSGREHLKTIIDGMRDNRRVIITHRGFDKEEASEYPIEPYCLRLSDNRWYVLGKNNHGQIRIYGLDRIEEAKLTDVSFHLPKKFNPEDYFSRYYGVVMDHTVKPTRIVIRANEYHKHYMMSLPLHHSQVLLEDAGEYADFEFFLAPTYDFVMKLLQFGNLIEVLRPKSLRLTLKEWISDMHDLYKDDEDDKNV